MESEARRFSDRTYSAVEPYRSPPGAKRPPMLTAIRNLFIAGIFSISTIRRWASSRSRVRVLPSLELRQLSDRAAPLLGQDNQYVLAEILGYNEDKITELVSSGALG